MENINQRIEALCKEADRLSMLGNPTNPSTHIAEYSSKWCKVVSQAKQPQTTAGQKVYCFIALKDFENKALGAIKAGDIHMAATWKQPAKHARGSVFANDFGNCLTEYGIKYIRYGNFGVDQNTPDPNKT